MQGVSAGYVSVRQGGCAVVICGAGRGCRDHVNVQSLTLATRCFQNVFSFQPGARDCGTNRFRGIKESHVKLEMAAAASEQQIAAHMTPGLCDNCTEAPWR